MNDIQKDIATPSRTKAIMAKHNVTVKKSLGQNFLIEPSILTKMLEAAGVDQETNVIEIGPGIGALTERLARAAHKVLAFEIDGRLIPVLADTLAPYTNVTVIHEDILKADLPRIFAEQFEGDRRLLVVANLPYYITTPIIMTLLESQLPIDGFAMMMQKEVAQRMTAQPKTKAYGSLTIAIQYWCEAHIAFTVPKTVFNPAPNVDSAILVLKRRATPLVEVANEAYFFAVIKCSFTQRRKTLWNNLAKVYATTEADKEQLKQALVQASIEPSRRAETLTIEEFADLARAMEGRGLTIQE